MKWFKHMSDSYSNLKHRQVIKKFGMEGYGFFWICDEIVAQQGQNFRIKAEKDWKFTLEDQTGITESRQNELLNFFAEKGLIDKEALKIGDLFMPKLAEYGDEYREKKERKARQYRDNVGLDKTRLDKIRLEEIRLDKIKVFNFWLSQNLIQHQKLSVDADHELLKILSNGFSVESINAAISCYATVLEKDIPTDLKKYWWSHEWTLYEFLKRGFKQFEGKLPDNYLKKKTEFMPKLSTKVDDFSRK